MQTRINLSLGYVLSFLLFICGVVLAVNSITMENKVNNAYTQETLDINNLEEGQYFAGYIDSVLLSYNENGIASAVSHEHLKGITALQNYTIKDVNGKYIGFYISDVETLSKLQNLHYGQGEPVYVEGEVIRPYNEINYKWYENALNVLGREQVEKLVTPQFMIEQTQLSKIPILLEISIVICVIAILIFFGLGGVKGFIIHRTAETIRFDRDLQTAHNRDIELLIQNEKKTLKVLERWNKDIKTNGFFSIFLLIVAVVLFLQSSSLSTIFGVIILLYAIRGIFKMFINSDYGLAVKFSDLFDVYTFPKKIAYSNLRIEEYERIRNEHKKQEERTKWDNSKIASVALNPDPPVDYHWNAHNL